MSSMFEIIDNYISYLLIKTKCLGNTILMAEHEQKLP